MVESPLLAGYRQAVVQLAAETAIGGLKNEKKVKEFFANGNKRVGLSI